LLETKAEKFIGVAAASILARQSFNEWFIKKEQSGLKLPKGASATVEQKAKELLSQLGESKLHEYAKMHFKTIGKIKR
jgi:ribonuclease HIII